MIQPATRHYWDLDRSSIWHPYTRHSVLEGEPFPIMDRGEGVYLFDTEGNRYFDAISSWWACNLGHGNSRIVEAISRQARELQHSILGNLSHKRAIELASSLINLFPDERRRVLFAGDGACAVEASLRVAVQYWSNIAQTGKCRFAALEDAYHGDTIGAMSVGYMPSFHGAYRPLLFPVLQAETPCCAACGHDCSPETCGLECFSSMQRIFREHAHELAGVIVEPLCQGAAGMRMYSPAYLRRLSELCREHDVLLIVDEIAMGMGRTGKMFAFEHAGIDPDIVCLGKGLTAGYLPLSAAVVKEHVYATFSDLPEDHTLYHGHTFAGNPIAAAAAVECLRVYEDEKVVERSARCGRLLSELLEAFRDLPGVTNVRSLGMVGAFDLADLPGGESGAARAQRLRRDLLGRGVLIRPLGNVVYLMPPLIVSEAVLAETVHILREAVEE